VIDFRPDPAGVPAAVAAEVVARYEAGTLEREVDRRRTGRRRWPTGACCSARSPPHCGSTGTRSPPPGGSGTSRAGCRSRTAGPRGCTLRGRNHPALVPAPAARPGLSWDTGGCSHHGQQRRARALRCSEPTHRAPTRLAPRAATPGGFPDVPAMRATCFMWMSSIARVMTSLAPAVKWVW